jgi:hypothetical protein
MSADPIPAQGANSSDDPICASTSRTASLIEVASSVTRLTRHVAGRQGLPRGNSCPEGYSKPLAARDSSTELPQVRAVALDRRLADRQEFCISLPDPVQGQGKAGIPERSQPGPRPPTRPRRESKRQAQAVENPPKATLLPPLRRPHRPRYPHPHRPGGQSKAKKAQCPDDHDHVMLLGTVDEYKQFEICSVQSRHRYSASHRQSPGLQCHAHKSSSNS